MTNQEVIQKFLKNDWRIYTNSQNLTARDGSLFSYGLKIANIYDKYIWDYSIDEIEECTGFRSVTTRQHIGLIKRAIEPDKKDWKIISINKK
jgi:hypothetical protein